MAYGLFRRKHSWYWRGNFRRHARHTLTFRHRPLSYSLDVALSLGSLARNERIEIAARLSALFTTWMSRLEMMQVLEKLPKEEVRMLASWALADIRDLFIQRVPEPGKLPAADRASMIEKLRAEAICIQTALDTGSFEMVEGLAAAILRRKSVVCDFYSGEFAAFVRAVAPSLIEARLNELVRLGAPLGPPPAIEAAVQGTPAPLPAPAAIPLHMQSPPMVAAATTRAGHTVSGRTIEDCLESFLRKARVENRLMPKTESQYRQTLNMLIAIFGNVPAFQVSRAMAADFQAFVLTLPKHYGQSARYAGLELRDIPSRAKAVGDRTTLTAQTWNRHQVALSTVWQHAVKNGDSVENVFDGQRFRRPKARGGRRPDHEERPPFMEENLKRAFSSPIFTGMRSDQFRHQPGNLVEHNALFWVPIIMATTGLRREEAAQLKFCDIGSVNGVDCLLIREGSGQTLKNDFSARNVPIPSVLRQLGFLEFVEDRKAKKGEFLFHECKPMGQYQRRGEVVGKAFGRYLRKIGIAGPGLCLYSLRHDFSGHCVIADVKDCLHDRLMGHSTGRIAVDIYASGLEAKLLEEIEKLDVSYLAAVLPYSRRKQI